MIKTRFAPSPTGDLHIGGARTALFSWALARRHGGKFVLRIDDTDAERSTEAASAGIIDSLRWLGLDWDEGPILQSSRIDLYRQAALDLVKRGRAYPCWATREELDELRQQQVASKQKPKYDNRWRPENAARLGLKPTSNAQVIRLIQPTEGRTEWDDLVKGPISVPNDQLDDLVLVRSDGTPTYNFSSAVDDLALGITHVVRGDDHVNNTPRQLNIMSALDQPAPRFGHLPMIVGDDKKPLAKREGSGSVLAYRNAGIKPAALLNYLARLGWSHGNDEFFTLAQFVEWFNLEKVQKSPARFDRVKLDWLNRKHA